MCLQRQRIYCSFFVKKGALKTKRLPLLTDSAKTSNGKPFFFRTAESARPRTSGRCAALPSFWPSVLYGLGSGFGSPGRRRRKWTLLCGSSSSFRTDMDWVLPPRLQNRRRVGKWPMIRSPRRDRRNSMRRTADIPAVAEKKTGGKN